MLHVETPPLSADDWARITAGWGANVPQSWAYGAAKAEDGSWTVERGTFSEAAGTPPIGAFQAARRALPLGLPGGLVWISRGPLSAPHRTQDPGHRAGMLAALRHYYVEKQELYLRIAPPWPNDSGFISMAQQAGFAPAGLGGWQSATIDLGADEDTLRRGLKQKWRNALNQGERAGLEIATTQGGPLFEAFLADHHAFLTRLGFAATVTADFIARLQRHLPAGGKLTAFRAAHDGQVLGWVLMAHTGTGAEYLAGHTTEAGRTMSAGQVLLWRAVLAAKAEGRMHFDLGGMNPELTPPGILRFKQGLGATPYGLAPEIEALPSGPLAGAAARLVRWRVAHARSAT